MDWIWAGISRQFSFQAHWVHALRIFHQQMAQFYWKLWVLSLYASIDSSLVQMISNSSLHQLSFFQFFRLKTFAVQSEAHPFSPHSMLVENTTKQQTSAIKTNNGHATILVLAELVHGSWLLEILSSILQLIIPRFRVPSEVLVSKFLLWRFGVLQVFEWQDSWWSLENYVNLKFIGFP